MTASTWLSGYVIEPSGPTDADYERIDDKNMAGRKNLSSPR